MPRPSFARAGQMLSPSQTPANPRHENPFVPSQLRRYQQTEDLHFITFSCYLRQPKLRTPSARAVFERSLEQTRQKYRLCVLGYVVMTEHVHLLLSEPQTSSLATALQALKQSVSRRLALRSAEPFWLERYYDFNVRTERKRIEKLHYMHRNPLVRGLVEKPEQWPWSSFVHYATGKEGAVEIESEWTVRRKALMGDLREREFEVESDLPSAW